MKKTKSSEDGRLVHLSVTDKFLQIYGSSERYVSILANRMKRKYTEEDLEKFSAIMQDISDNMMTEVNKYLRNKAELPEGTIPVKD